MQHTKQGRITDPGLARLEEDAERYPKPWTMGVGSHVMKALIAELRELRAVVGAVEALSVEWRERGYGMYERCADEVTAVLAAASAEGAGADGDDGERATGESAEDDRADGGSGAATV